MAASLNKFNFLLEAVKNFIRIGRYLFWIFSFSFTRSLALGIYVRIRTVHLLFACSPKCVMGSYLINDCICEGVVLNWILFCIPVFAIYNRFLCVDHASVWMDVDFLEEWRHCSIPLMSQGVGVLTREEYRSHILLE